MNAPNNIKNKKNILNKIPHFEKDDQKSQVVEEDSKAKLLKFLSEINKLTS